MEEMVYPAIVLRIVQNTERMDQETQVSSKHAHLENYAAGKQESDKLRPFLAPSYDFKFCLSDLLVCGQKHILGLSNVLRFGHNYWRIVELHLSILLILDPFTCPLEVKQTN